MPTSIVSEPDKRSKKGKATDKIGDPSTFTTVNKEWKVITSIGSGGFGDVYLAREISTKMKVAIKYDTKGISDIGGQMFKKEVDFLTKLNDSMFTPNLLAYGKYQGVDYLVLELLGSSLWHVQRELPGYKLSISSTLRLV